MLEVKGIRKCEICYEIMRVHRYTDPENMSHIIKLSVTTDITTSYNLTCNLKCSQFQ
jgi:hypothetical protein